MRCYKLLKENKFYNEDNIKDFDMNKLKDAVGVQVSTLGAMGAGGLVYIITKDGEEILFDYFSSTKERNVVHFKNSPVFDIITEHLPVVDEILGKEWELLSRQAGWSFYIKKDYLKKFYKKCKKIIKTDERFFQLKNDKVSKNIIINKIIIPQGGPDILFDLIKNKQ